MITKAFLVTHAPLYKNILLILMCVYNIPGSVTKLSHGNIFTYGEG